MGGTGEGVGHDYRRQVSQRLTHVVCPILVWLRLPALTTTNITPNLLIRRVF